MKSRRIIYRSILVIFLCGVSLLYSQTPEMFSKVEHAVAASVSKGVQVGQEALPFQLTTLQGKQVALEDYRGKTVVLNFFATWCYPCQEEMPLIVEMEKRLKEKGGHLLAINLTSEESDQSGAGLKTFLSHYNALFDPLLDKEGSLMKEYQIIGIPTTVVIDEHGVIKKRINGGLTYSMMEELLELVD